MFQISIRLSTTKNVQKRHAKLYTSKTGQRSFKVEFLKIIISHGKTHMLAKVLRVGGPVYNVKHTTSDEMEMQKIAVYIIRCTLR